MHAKTKAKDQGARVNTIRASIRTAELHTDLCIQCIHIPHRMDKTSDRVSNLNDFLIEGRHVCIAC